MTLAPQEQEFGLACWEGAPAPMGRAHRHQDIEINVVVEGTMTYLFGGRHVELGPGTTTLFWAAIPHQLVTAAAGAHVRWLTLPMATVSAWGLDRAVLGRSLRGWPVVVSRGAATHPFAQWSAEVAGDDRELRTAAMLEIEAYVRRLLHGSELDPSPVVRPSDDGSIGQATTMARFVVNHFAERIGPADVAAAVHLHPRYAMRVFRKVTGLTIGRYLEQCRVAEAQRRLLTSDDTVTEVAHLSGFGSASRLYASFAAVCGQSPGAFRRAHTQPGPTAATDAPGAATAVS
ncbi:helix-turn-helix domain-containing protein [Amorphoplanes nipponensis]|uniref:AraC family transcriptional regulator n=1 Tax=Actinoplanes nipponensis TaxID=135950 RepID=A0A919MMC9_9ACTN|nr:helix-turn-helix domain-containing protein [Actinoplanes nipponensis]GIE47283.1 AraC family transcriptional regulator [Actinoplanes nipponensis]